MSTASASPAEAAAGQRRILVWDLPVRVFHWLMAASFALAWLTSESERWQLVHVTAGFTMAGLVVFRVLWGFVGTRHARFADFVRGPSAVLGYLKSLAAGKPEHHLGHNPAGGLAILALLGLGALVAATGWASYADVAGEALEELHEGLATAMLALVGLHVAAVVLSSRLHRENLVAAMVTGRKSGPSREGIRRPWRGVALALLLAVAAFWWLQWREAPALPWSGLQGPPGLVDRGAGHHGGQARSGDHDEDD